MDGNRLKQLVLQISKQTSAHVRNGGLPFGALVASSDGTVLADGFNRVGDDCDPTAHAEIVACRAAALRLGQTHLNGTVLVATGEPCGLCYLTAHLAGIRQIVYTVSRDDAARAGFDYRSTYAPFATDPRHWPGYVQQVVVKGVWRPFEK